MEFKDKVVIITGGTSGIGFATAKLFHKEGANVVLISRSVEKLTSASEELKERVNIFSCDVQETNRVKEIVSQLKDKFKRIDILINNAGITRDKLLLRTEESDFNAVIDTNLKGAFNFSREVVKIMLSQKFGVIINMSSAVGITGNPGQSVYAASKAALIAFTKSLAHEVGSRNIRVLAVAPGFITTPMTETLPEAVKKSYLEKIALRRFGTPEEVGEFILFLASPKASYLTGQVFIIDGGLV